MRIPRIRARQPMIWGSKVIRSNIIPYLRSYGVTKTSIASSNRCSLVVLGYNADGWFTKRRPVLSFRTKQSPPSFRISAGPKKHRSYSRSQPLQVVTNINEYTRDDGWKPITTRTETHRPEGNGPPNPYGPEDTYQSLELPKVLPTTKKTATERW